MRFLRRPTWGDFYKEIFDLMHKFKMQKSRIDELEAENRRLREALEGLLDVQNDAPLGIREEEWKQAVERARAALQQERQGRDG